MAWNFLCAHFVADINGRKAVVRAIEGNRVISVEVANGSNSGSFYLNIGKWNWVTVFSICNPAFQQFCLAKGGELEKYDRNYGKEPDVLQKDACEGIGYFMAKKGKQ